MTVNGILALHIFGYNSRIVHCANMVLVGKN